MSALFDRNLELLQKRWPDIASFFADYESENEYTDLPCFVENIDGRDVLVYSDGEHFFQLDSLYSLNQYFDDWIYELTENWELEGKLLMFGLGNGMYAEQFLRRVSSDHRIYVYEPDTALFWGLLHLFDYSGIFDNERFELIFGGNMDETEFRSYYKNHFNYIDVHSFRKKGYLNYNHIFPELAEKYIKNVNGAFSQVASNMYLAEDRGKEMNENIFSNMKYIFDSYDAQCLVNCVPKGVPAIVVAAGPSLDNNIDDLKEAQGKAFIIAIDTAAKPLSLRGIRPDIIILTDALKGAKYMSEPDSRQIPLLTNPDAGKYLIEAHEGKKLFYDSLCSRHVCRCLETVGKSLLTIVSGGTVAANAFTLAYLAGAKTIILMGQDLAYANKGKSHSEIAVGAGAVRQEKLDEMVWDVDIYDQPIQTSGEFLLYKNWYEESIVAIKKSGDFHVIDASEGGIKIVGTEIMKLSDAIQRECKTSFCFAEVMEKIPPFLSDEQRKKFGDLIFQIPNQFETLKKRCDEVELYNNRMKELIRRGDYRSKEMIELSRKSNRLLDQIQAMSVLEYIDNESAGNTNSMLRGINKLEKDESAELNAVCEVALGYVSSLREAEEYLYPRVKQMIEELKGLNI